MVKLRKSISVLIVFVVLLATALSGCGGNEQLDSTGTANQSAANGSSAQGTDTSSNDSEVVLNMWYGANVSGEQHNPVSDALAKITGVRLNIINGDDNKYRVLLAGGDLPDIVSQQTTINELLNSNQLIALDSLIDKYGDNLKKVFPQKLEYSKRFLSNGQNKIYFLPVSAYMSDPQKPDITKMGGNQGTYLRWDIYAKIGYPEINSYDDFLNVLKKMQDAYPKNKDGKKVYAISGWSDWGIWPWHISNMYSNGCQDMTYGIWFDNISGKAIPQYTDDRFWESVAFYNKAYRMGLLDPEAFTMKFQNYSDKLKVGQVLMTYASWIASGANDSLVTNGYQDSGFECVMTGLPYASGVVATDTPIGFGPSKAICITKNCKNPDKAMKFIDYLNGYEGARLAWSGIKDRHYEIKNGVPVPTQALIEGTKSDTNYNDKEGYQLYASMSLNSTQICPDGFPADIRDTDTEKAKNLNNIDKEYIQHFGSQYLYPGQVVYDFVKQSKIKTWTKNWVYKEMVEQPSDDTQKIMSTIDEYMKVQIVAIITAKSDDDFKEQVKKAKDWMESKGYSKSNAEILSLYNKAQNAMGDFDPYKK